MGQGEHDVKRQVTLQENAHQHHSGDKGSREGGREIPHPRLGPRAGADVAFVPFLQTCTATMSLRLGTLPWLVFPISSRRSGWERGTPVVN